MDTKEEKSNLPVKEEISPEVKDDTEEVVETTPKEVVEDDSDKEVTQENENENENEKENEKEDEKEKENTSKKSSSSSLNKPKSILRKRKTEEEEENSESFSDEMSSISSIKKKHIEFSDDNIVYTLEREEEEEEEGDEEEVEDGQNFNKSLVNSVMVIVKRYLLFAIVISAGFCFSYYSYNKNKKPFSSHQRTGAIIGRSEQKQAPIQWEKPVEETEKKTPLIPIKSLTLTDFLNAETKTESVLLEETTESVEGGRKSKRAEKEKSFKRIVAVGDVHGDFRKLASVLYTAKLIDPYTDWIAEDTLLIQTGDLIDRGSDTIPIFDLMLKLREQAHKMGSEVYILLGNHEVMNLQEDYRYVTRGDVMSFGGLYTRKREFALTGKYGKLLREEMNTTMIIDDTLFVHAGLNTAYAKAGVDQINNYVHYILQNYPAEQLFYATVFGNDGPFWTRLMALGEEEYTCEELDSVLEILEVKRMVVGHTVQENGRINTRCKGKLIMIDVGLSEFYGGNFAYLEFLNEKNQIWAVYSDVVRQRLS